MTAKADSERFQSGARSMPPTSRRPRAGCASIWPLPICRIFFPQATRSLRALDLGCGTGATAVRLARLGIHVTLLDSSPPMLDIAKRAAREAGVTEKDSLQHGDATQLANLFPARVVRCNSLPQHPGICDDPGAVLRSAARALRDSSAILSVLVRNQAGEVFKAAIQDGDLAAAENGLTAEWGHESLYGGRVRLFTSDSLRAMLRRGVTGGDCRAWCTRPFGLFAADRFLAATDYERIFELERKLGRRPEFAAVSRYTHCLARRVGSVVKDSA